MARFSNYGFFDHFFRKLLLDELVDQMPIKLIKRIENHIIESHINHEWMYKPVTAELVFVTFLILIIATRKVK